MNNFSLTAVEEGKGRSNSHPPQPDVSAKRLKIATVAGERAALGSDTTVENSIADLPDKVLVKVFRYFDVADQGQLRRVHHGWNKMLKSTSVKSNIRIEFRDKWMRKLLNLIDKRTKIAEPPCENEKRASSHSHADKLKGFIEAMNSMETLTVHTAENMNRTWTGGPDFIFNRPSELGCENLRQMYLYGGFLNYSSVLSGMPSKVRRVFLKNVRIHRMQLVKSEPSWCWYEPFVKTAKIELSKSPKSTDDFQDQLRVRFLRVLEKNESNEKPLSKKRVAEMRKRFTRYPLHLQQYLEAFVSEFDPSFKGKTIDWKTVDYHLFNQLALKQMHSACLHNWKIALRGDRARQGDDHVDGKQPALKTVCN